MRTTLLALGVALAGLLAAERADAQAAQVTESLTDVRLANVAADTAQADVLLSWGVGSVLLGSAEAAVGIGGDRGRWFGGNSALWGAIDTVIAIPWVLGTRRERAAIAHDRSLVGSELGAARVAAIGRSRTQERSFLINLALDVVYVVGGSLLFYFTNNTSDFFAGAGLGALSQGTFLFAFDAVGFFLARGRTSRLERTAEPSSTPPGG